MYNLAPVFCDLCMCAKQMVKEKQDIMGSNCLKGVSGTVIVDKKGIKHSLPSVL